MRHLILILTFPLFTISLNGINIEPWGVDSELVYIERKNPQPQVPQKHKGQLACKALIRFFQDYISPIDGPRSSFYPTSSQYALDAIQKYGVFQGISLGCDRLMRENSEEWVYERTDKYGIERKVDPVR